LFSEDIGGVRLLASRPRAARHAGHRAAHGHEGRRAPLRLGLRHRSRRPARGHGALGLPLRADRAARGWRRAGLPRTVRAAGLARARDQADPPRHQRPRRALPEPAGHREDARDTRPPLAGAHHPRRGRGLAPRGVRGARRAAVRGARRRDRRVPPSHAPHVDQRPRPLRGHVLPGLRRPRAAEARAEDRYPDLDRRSHRRRAQARRHARRRLAPDRAAAARPPLSRRVRGEGEAGSRVGPARGSRPEGGHAHLPLSDGSALEAAEGGGGRSAALPGHRGGGRGRHPDLRGARGLPFRLRPDPPGVGPSAGQHRALRRRGTAEGRASRGGASDEASGDTVEGRASRGGASDEASGDTADNRAREWAEPEDARVISHAEACRLIETPAAALDELLARAAEVRDRGRGRTVTFSAKVFVPLTTLCRDYCGYCTFRRDPGEPGAHTMTPEEVLALARAGARLGAKEALFSLGDRPEAAFPGHREFLRRHGHRTTLGYLRAVCELTLSESSLLPHANPGVMAERDLAALREVTVSMGLMLETVSERLGGAGLAHDRAPDKVPARRLRTIALAGKLSIPFTTGILVGIGETQRERVDALAAIRDLHERYGHIQEVIIQNFRAKPRIPMRDQPEPPLADLLRTLAVARLLLGPEVNIQAPPNLSPRVYP